MRLDLLQPDAKYDLAHGRPEAIERDGNGSFIYRYGVVPEMSANEDGEGEIQTGWQCREVRVWEKPSKRVLKKAVIRSLIDESEEFAIVNGYGRHALGIKTDSAAVDAYIEYLRFVDDLDAMLASDIADANKYL